MSACLQEGFGKEQKLIGEKGDSNVGDMTWNLVHEKGV